MRSTPAQHIAITSSTAAERITEWRIDQGQLKPSERTADAALSAVEDALIELDERGRVVWLNSAGEELVRKSGEQARGAPLESLLPVVPTSGGESVFRLLEREHKEVPVWHGVLKRDSEAPRDVRVRVVSAAAAVPGAHPKTLVLIRDVTEQQGLCRELEFSDRLIALGQLAAGMAHEIRNPLTALFAQAFLLKEMLSRAEAKATRAHLALSGLVECVAEMEESLQHIAEVVTGMGDFSNARIRGGASADVNRAVRWAVRASAPEMRCRGRVAVSAGELPPVALDETRLGQVLLNLLINAALALDPTKFASNLVSVSVREHRSRVIIQVDDTGSGMCPQTVARIFEPFFTTRPDGEGSGLGLSVTSTIVRSAGGTIEVESELGRGSTFRIALPVASAPTPERPSCPAPSRPKRGARLLLVDDDERLLPALAQALSVDHFVVCVSSGNAALERIRRGDSFDVVVCDVLMLGMTGPALRANVERLSPDLAKAFIFLSGGGRRAQELLAGSNELCLMKPVCFAELSAAILSLTSIAS